MMAPLKPNNICTRASSIQQKTINNPLSVATRSRATLNTNLRSKRKADCSPLKEPSNAKRTAMCDITNAKKLIVEDKNKRIPATSTNNKQPVKKAIVQSKVLPSVKTVIKPKTNNENAVPQAPGLNGVVTRAAVKQITSNQTAIKPKEPLKDLNANASRVKTRLSNEFEKTEESIYSSALEDLSVCSSSAGGRSKDTTEYKTPVAEKSSPDVNNLSCVSLVTKELATKLNLGNHEVPAGVDDFDLENWDDTNQVSHYAMDIFNYLKSKEPSFDIPDYMDRQVCLTRWMRSLLVDWMVEVQESFELNHETLYLGVKLVDLYLSRMTVGKETLQLVGAAAMFVASKYDERIPPLIDDFLYICDGAYSRRELIRMEINLLKICDFNLGIPLSYRFLRRYARCAKITMPTLTLARYILEYSLMDYATVKIRDSKLAAASLYLALRMRKLGDWTPALEFYSGYKRCEILFTVYLLNNGLHQKQKSPLLTVKNKYSHKIFFEVAKSPLITNAELENVV